MHLCKLSLFLRIIQPFDPVGNQFVSVKVNTEMKLQVYADRLSQPCRAIIIFCKVNGIEFEEVKTEISKMQHRSPEYAAVNPMKQLPAIVVDDEFKLYESHAILSFLAEAYPEVPEHWYPKDLFKRAQINSILDWHHTNLRPGSVGLVMHTTLAPIFGRPLNPQAADESAKLLSKSLEHIQSYWLKEDGPFLLRSSQPSIADLSLVCEIMQPQLVEDKVRERVLSTYPEVLKWIDATKNATQPHFDEVHALLFQVKEVFKKKRFEGELGETKAN